MSAFRNVRKNFTAFIDGRGYAGNVESFTPPKLALKTEDFQGGGMIAPTEITMGMEKMEAEIVLLCDEASVMQSFTVREGVELPITVREALESGDGSITAVVHNLRGKVREIDRGEVKSGEKGTTKLVLAVNYYKLTYNGTTAQEIDVVNMIHNVGGNDALAGIRAALGI